MALALLLAGGCTRAPRPAEPAGDTVVEISDLTSDAEQWADSVLGHMSLERKAAQLFMPAVYSSSDYWTLRQVAEYARIGVGGLVLLKGDTLGVKSIADTIGKSAVPPFVSIDAEWGLAMRLEGTKRYSANGELPDSVSEEWMFDYGAEVGADARRLGINMVLGPVADVNVPGGFIGRRSFGGDEERVARLAVAYGRGLQSEGVIGVAKHFPGHGSVTSDSHRSKGVITRSLAEIDSIDLHPFRAWVDGGLPAVMVGHLAVPSIDPESLPAAVSPTVIGDLLRGDLGFGGLVLTDAMSMGGAERAGADRAVEAGADLILAPVDTEAEIAGVVAAVKEGRLAQSKLDAAVRRILVYKYLYAR